MKLEGIVCKGLGLATKTIPLQKPFFKQKGLKNIDNFKECTINVNISPLKYELLKLDYYFEKIKWDENEIEDFGFIKIEKIIYNNSTWEKPGYIYIPYNSPHFENKNQFEVISVEIESIENNKEIKIEIQEGKLRYNN